MCYKNSFKVDRRDVSVRIRIRMTVAILKTIGWNLKNHHYKIRITHIRTMAFSMDFRNVFSFTGLRP